MGKTKTVVISGAPEEKKEKYQKGKEGKKKQVKGVGLKGGERVVAIEGGPVKKVKSPEVKKKEKKVQKKERGKKYVEAKAKVDGSKLYSLPEAIALAKEGSYSAFEGSIEIHLVTTKAITTSVDLPHSTGSNKKVEVADEKTVEKLKEGKIDFDILLSTPEMMPQLVPYARILGPKGMMPNPKNGTLIKKVGDAQNFSQDKLSLKSQKGSKTLHAKIGKAKQGDKEIEANAKAIIKAVGKNKISRIYLCPTMGPSVKVEI